MSRYFSFSVVVVLIFSALSFAAVPQTINYQGYLTDTGGSPVNTAVAMTFTIYDAAAAGTALWTETQPTLAVNNGIYAAALGAINPIDPAVIDGDLWLGVKVGTDAEMTPRQKLNSVPFALVSNSTRDPIIEALRIREKGELSYLVDNGDGTIYDPISQLTWKQTPRRSIKHYDANTYCASLDFAGRNNWRLANFLEIQNVFQVLFSKINSPFNFSYVNPMYIASETDGYLGIGLYVHKYHLNVHDNNYYFLYEYGGLASSHSGAETNYFCVSE